jgi:tripartite-type tricarboxylate transporter receptor subunit TctC
MKTIILILTTFLSLNAYSTEIRWLVPYSPGGSADKISRIIAKHISTPDFKIILEYKTGAGGIVAANYLASDKTSNMVMLSGGAVVTAPILNPSSVKYQIEKDFVLIDYVGIEPTILVVNKSSGIKSFQEFQKTFKEKTLFYGSAGIGTNSHISANIIANNNKNLIHVPYQGGSAAILGLLANDVQWLLESNATLSGFISSGDLIPIAVLSNHRLSEYPNIPTLGELGVDDKEYYRWHSVVANSSSDPAVLTELSKRLNNNDLRDELTSQVGIQTPVSVDSNFLQNEYGKMKSILSK